MTFAVVLAAAVVVGLLLGLLGGGGSILTVPVLVYLAGQQPDAAIPASLFVVAVTSAAALVPHARAQRLEWRTGLVLGTAGLAGAYAGGRLAAHLPPTMLLTGFGLLMATAATLMIRSCRRPLRVRSHTGRLPALLTLGCTVGLVTGLIGAGGGFVIVPVLVLVAGLPMATAVGTSLLVITLQAAAGLAGQLQHATIDWTLTGIVTTLAVAGAVVGARLGTRIPARLLRTGFGWFLVVMAASVLLEQAPAAVRHALAGTLSGRLVLGAGCAVLAVAAARHVHVCRTTPVNSA
ncbi:MAG: sulfite exporter TauE/SafE family protein [Hamadaea sp.]|uniref:sulfite exporter TauE/SafE family protein n=1 Tax=Hamadaea sp. TaxID=2024425 RepID=UPI0018231A0E|nr:sulfite exporter TauE/SafE family protein [Hamadaea sp.]NUT18878.1 sulfite exporter TauE/SafE family protein [Hamadaea sp.]